MLVPSKGFQKTSVGSQHAWRRTRCSHEMSSDLAHFLPQKNTPGTAEIKEGRRSNTILREMQWALQDFNIPQPHTPFCRASHVAPDVNGIQNAILDSLKKFQEF